MLDAAWPESSDGPPLVDDDADDVPSSSPPPGVIIDWALAHMAALQINNSDSPKASRTLHPVSLLTKNLTDVFL
jgi:hypothetical protein